MPMPGPIELVIILVIALLLLGPKKLPQLGGAVGSTIREFRHAVSRDDEPEATPDSEAAPAPPAAVPAKADGKSVEDSPIP